MLVNSVFAFFVPLAAHRGGWVWLCVVRFIQGLGEGPIVRIESSLFLADISSFNLLSLGSLHPCFASKVDSTQRALENGRICLCWRTIRYSHLNASVRLVICLTAFTDCFKLLCHSSGLLAEYGFAGGWPSIFYVFGTIGIVWCVFFLWTCREDPQSHDTIDEDERKYIVNQLWGSEKMSSPPIPWRSILTSMPFFAILLAQ